MMQFIRERSKGLLSFLLMGFISLTFALWGINSYFTGHHENAVAKIGGRTITSDEFSRFYQQQYRQLQSVYGNAFRPEMIDENQLKRKVLDAMVADAALRQHLIQNHMVVSDHQLAEAINQFPAFQDEGRFSSERYKQWLGQRGYSPVAFENELRGSMLTEQMRMAVHNSSLLTNVDLQGIVRLMDQKRNIAVMTVPLAATASQIAVTDDEIKDFYTKHPEGFQSQDRIRVNYVLIRREALAAQLKIDESTLRDRYATDAKRFNTPERRHVYHILLENEAAARELGDRLRQTPDKFKELAREFSKDSGSAANGGDLGWVEPGMLPAPLDQAVYSAKSGEPFGPVKRSDGYYWLLVDAIEPGKHQSFEAVHSKLLEEYRNEKLAQRWSELIESVETSSFENPSSLQPIADLVHVSIQTTDWFTRDAGDAPANSPRFRQAGFTDDVLKEGLNSEVIKLDDGTVAILRLEAHQPPQAPPLEQVKPQVKQAVQRIRAGEIADQQIRDMGASLNSGENPVEVSNRFKIKYHEIGWIGRQENNTLPAELVERVFSASQPKDGKASNVALTLSNGDRVLVLVRQTKDGDPTAMDASVMEQTRERVSNLRGELELSSYLSLLRKNSDIKTYPDRL